MTDHPLVDLTAIADSVGRFLRPAPLIGMNVVGGALSATGALISMPNAAITSPRTYILKAEPKSPRS